ncbi:MAG: SCO family protein [Pikeienuella sp.]|uniref:SCO family protein n=1 Tax=Pikeienuella sp. TaxID=2831957 RepID=UPI00391B9061
MKSSRIYGAAALLLAAGLGGGAAFFAMNDNPFAECGGGMATGAAAIGGPFTLVSGAGERVTSAEVIDRPALLYFGYTFCPDVCPVDAAAMAQTADLLKERGLDVKTAFITVDPARDNEAVVRDFAANLHPEMIGLTGSEAEIDAAKSAYRVYAQKAPGQAEDDPYYLVDHSAFIYLMAAEDRLLTVFRHGVPPEDMAETAACYLRAAGA